MTPTSFPPELGNDAQVADMARRAIHRHPTKRDALIRRGHRLEDLTQEVLMALWRQSRGTKPYTPSQGKPMAYVSMVARCQMGRLLDRVQPPACMDPVDLPDQHGYTWTRPSGWSQFSGRSSRVRTPRPSRRAPSPRKAVPQLGLFSTSGT